MSDVILFHSTNSKILPTKISLKLLSNGHIFVDWKDLPKHRNIRQCVIHYKSLNTNQSHTIRVSRKKQNIILRKIQSGHLYEIHVCTIDRSNRIIASSECAQIQTKTLNEAPIFRVTKSTPDFIWLEWEKSDNIRLSDIESYKLIINGQTKATLPLTENKFVVNDGEFGQRYIFKLEMSLKDGKVVSSIPIRIHWPGVTMPKHHVFINGCEQLIICWGDSTSINNGNIESYTLHLYDSENRLLSKIGPNSPSCHQVWIKDVTKGVYYYILEIKLANSKKSICSNPKKIECGKESRAPILTYNYTDSNYREKLTNMFYHLIKIRDNMKSNRLLEKCENQLKQILSTFTNLTDSLRLNLTIESKFNENISKSYQLIIDNEESNISIPGFVKDFPLELSRRDKPYELAVLITPDLYGTKSKKILIDGSGHIPFFCAHFNQQRSIVSCSYTQTLLYEKQIKRPIHQGLLKSPQLMNKIQVYDLNENKKIILPSYNKGHRISIILFYIKRCIPSITHLNYFSNYASSHRTQYNYISINCNQDDIDDLKNLTQSFQDIQCYTDFLSKDFEYEQNENEQSLHELLSLDGVPTYFILNFSSKLNELNYLNNRLCFQTGRIVWKGRLCAQNQLEYNRAMDHIIAEFQQQPCSTENCELCDYHSMDDTRIDSELTTVVKNLQSIIQQQSLQIATRQQEEHNRTRRVFSMKKNQENK